ncbi:NAD(P)-dependent oxidoreductase [Streptomyces chartreusis]|uniref:D-isomer specific 2-hydroxyacid dehydrogenase NAD-binding domain-containing protein n=1 Tax=Streptomyces chartreusis TaxID=1969 RepID=A0A7I0NSV6_STRCX|nr:NAD(P)-dependent oxidoreductase [Streptomyces chartreusis]QKZ16149.1 hypothetical protein HUT05_01400 [Streptomyces chartreusis]
MRETVCVPDRDRAAALLEAKAAVEDVMVWDGTGPAPAGISRTTFLVAPYRATALEPGQLALMPGLRTIQLLSAGYEAWEAVVPTGVKLCTGRGVHGSSTAELAIAGVLMHLHRHPELLDQQKRAEWRVQPRSSCSGLSVAVIGPGDIGRTIAEVLAVLGAEVSLVGRRPGPGVVGPEELASLLPEQDVVVLATPLTAETRRMVNRDFLHRLRPGCIVVNVARGQIVDTDAVTEALKAGHIRAVLDVTDPEPLPKEHPLWAAPGLILTPHVGGGAEGWTERADALVRDQLNSLATGAELRNLVPMHDRGGNP